MCILRFPWNLLHFREREKVAETFRQCTFSFDNFLFFWFWSGWLLMRPPRRWNGLLVMLICWCTLGALLTESLALPAFPDIACRKTSLRLFNHNLPRRLAPSLQGSCCDKSILQAHHLEVVSLPKHRVKHRRHSLFRSSGQPIHGHSSQPFSRSRLGLPAPSDHHELCRGKPLGWHAPLLCNLAASCLPLQRQVPSNC